MTDYDWNIVCFIELEPFSYLTQNTLIFLEIVFWSFPGTDIVQRGDLVQGLAHGYSTSTWVFVFANGLLNQNPFHI
jgi:hypothetical protein